MRGCLLAVWKMSAEDSDFLALNMDLEDELGNEELQEDVLEHVEDDDINSEDDAELTAEAGDGYVL